MTTHQFIGYVVAHSERAILFQDHFWHEPDWMPRSQVDIYFDPESIEATIHASAWICKQKKIEECQEVMGAQKYERN